MNDYDFVMEAISKWKKYCEEAKGCCEDCLFEAFCDVNMFSATPPCNIEIVDETGSS